MIRERAYCPASATRATWRSILEEAAAVVMDARRAREIGVVAGARVRVHPPWHEVDVAASARTGFRRRRVVIASMVSVAAK